MSFSGNSEPNDSSESNEINESSDTNENNDTNGITAVRISSYYEYEIRTRVTTY